MQVDRQRRRSAGCPSGRAVLPCILVHHDPVQQQGDARRVVRSGRKLAAGDEIERTGRHRNACDLLGIRVAQVGDDRVADRVERKDIGHRDMASSCPPDRVRRRERVKDLLGGDVFEPSGLGAQRVHASRGAVSLQRNDRNRGGQREVRIDFRQVGRIAPRHDDDLRAGRGRGGNQIPVACLAADDVNIRMRLKQARYHVLKHPRQAGEQNCGGRQSRLLPPGYRARTVSAEAVVPRHGSEGRCESPALRRSRSGPNGQDHVFTHGPMDLDPCAAGWIERQRNRS
jgi:hypothetical protein